MNGVFIDGLGVLGPGLPDWSRARAILRGEAAWVDAEVKPNPSLLTGEARRRAGEHIRFAVQAAGEAVNDAGCEAATLASVFASSEADGHITHHICEQVALPTPQVSPTKFHNSVNNAPAGYWSMAVQSLAASSSLAGYDGSFAAGLLEAQQQVLADDRAVLLVVHDTQLPEPLHAVRPLRASFAVAMVLSPARTAMSRARLRLALAQGEPTPCEFAALEPLRAGNPAARALPLLNALARVQSARLVLPYLDDLVLVAELDDVHAR